MKTFEDALLADLREEVTARAQTTTTIHDTSITSFVRTTPITRKGRRIAVSLAACLALAAGGSVVVPLLGDEHTVETAYSVTTTEGGKVHVEIRSKDDAAGLTKRLAEAQIKAEVNYLPASKFCRRTPQGVDFEGAKDFLYSDGPAGIAFDVDPAKFRGATLVIDSSGFLGPHPNGQPDRRIGDLMIMVLKNGTFGPCTPIDLPGNRPTR